MAWIVLVASGVLESVWASALGSSNGFTKRGPTVLFAVALVLSMIGLSYAMTELAVGTAYAIWTGTGAALTVAWGMLTGAEAVTVLRVLFLAGIVGCVIGLKLLKHKPAAEPPVNATP